VEHVFGHKNAIPFTLFAPTELVSVERVVAWAVGGEGGMSPFAGGVVQQQNKADSVERSDGGQ